MNKLSEPYNKGDRWFIKTANGWEIEFVSYEEAWEFYRVWGIEEIGGENDI